MNKLYILVEGYAYQKDKDTYAASPTSYLVQTDAKNIVIDPGTNKEKLLEALNALGLKPSDIDLIFLSHYHPDHFFNISLFPDIPLCDGSILWQGDEERNVNGVIPETDIEILPTPGHSSEHCSLLVGTEEGIICLAQDVFWWEDGGQKSENEEDLLSLIDPFATDTIALLESRKLVLEKADWIIPGHGKKFKNPNKV